MCAPKRRYEAITVMATERLPLQLATRVLGVSESAGRQSRIHGSGQ